jgi:hypothetical protein
MGSATTEIDKMRKALNTVKIERAESGDRRSVEAIDQLLSNEMSVLRLAAIMAPKH